MKPQRLCILGATGSIGRSTLDVVARHPQRYEVFALSAQSRIDDLAQQCVRFRPRHAVVADDAGAARLREALRAHGVATEVHVGAQALCELAAHPEVDAVMAAIVGAAGLPSCLAAARAGKRLLLANKEALVVGGAMFMDAVRTGGATLLPIDSEHSAIFQCLPEDRRRWPETIDHIVLTASGGPFRARDPDSLADVTPEEACAHPNWVMGRKISVDSATMMNKALEVIEARWLFGLAPEQVRVVIHPQSIVHSMVVCRDRSVLAQLGTPDMRVPIAVGLAHPERIECGADALDFTRLGALTFEAPDARRFPSLFLAWDALRGPEGSTAVLNAANEEAVAAFLAGTIAFTDIHRINADVVARVLPDLPAQAGLDDVLALDARARSAARQRVQERAR
ncbi:1-deoxy-D-xylulose-5-phosphate reductoisomerase [Azohydromonas sediminis]|uniref:1-deoxy-D-xylulose-5-phosphate reductoisomerase n=1 Tax=Azohydromonas sediminis TaxID=2259674 RepID=UPI000E6545F3|nr:1-deoxy-D-xylulose-5-phosphate reductoisomerase [Azohydromonas sediminis]